AQPQIEARGLGLGRLGGRASQHGDRVVEGSELVSRLAEADQGIEPILVAREDLLEAARGFFIPPFGERGSGLPVGSGASSEQRNREQDRQPGHVRKRPSAAATRSAVSGSRVTRAPVASAMALATAAAGGPMARPTSWAAAYLSTRTAPVSVSTSTSAAWAPKV